jgi:hypothetical protein
MVIVIVASSIAVGKKVMGMLVMEGLPKKTPCLFFKMPVIMKSCHLQMFHAGHGVPGITVVFVSLPGYRGSS